MRRGSSPAISSVTSSTQRGGGAAQPRDREQRRRLHLDRDGAGRGPAPLARRVGVVEEVGRGDQDRVARRARQRGHQARVGGGALPGAERAARPVLAQRLAGDEQVAEPRAVGDGAAGPDPHEPPRPEPDQLLGHDRGRRPAHPGALDRQRRAVGRRARVAPQPAVGVEHLHRHREQVLGEAQRAPRVAGQQHALGDGRVRPQMDGSGGHVVRHGTRLAPAMAKKDKKKAKKDNKPAEAVGAVRTAVERTFQATADSAQSTRTRAQDLVDEVASAASRVREMIEDINVLEDLKRLRTEVETLTRRVAALEDKPAPAPAKKPAAAQSLPQHDIDPEDRGIVDREGRRHGSLDRRQAHRGQEAAAPKPRSPRPSRARPRPRSPPPPPDGLAAVRVRSGVRRGDGPDLHDDERGPGDGAGAARRRHAAAVRVRRPRHGREHPRRRARARATCTGSGPTTSRGSRRCG